MSASPFDTEKLVGSIARVLAAGGNSREVAILATAKASLEQTSSDNWNGGTYGYTLVLAVPAHFYGQFSDACKALEQSIEASGRDFFKAFPNNFLEAVTIVPGLIDVQDGWREKALAWAAGKGVTNQGRVRSDNVATRLCDGLLFRSEPEINLYKALKKSGVSFAPLPVFIRGGAGYQRIEPDFIIIKDGIVLHVEVDGDTVHQESPVEAHSRVTMLLYEGVNIERVNASECSSIENAEQCAKRLLSVLAKHKSAK